MRKSSQIGSTGSPPQGNVQGSSSQAVCGAVEFAIKTWKIPITNSCSFKKKPIEKWWYEFSDVCLEPSSFRSSHWFLGHGVVVRKKQRLSFSGHPMLIRKKVQQYPSWTAPKKLCEVTPRTRIWKQQIGMWTIPIARCGWYVKHLRIKRQCSISQKGVDPWHI